MANWYDLKVKGEIATVADFYNPMIAAIRNPVKTLEHHIIDDVLTEVESGTTHTNLGAGGALTLTLPQNPAVGTFFDFVVMAAKVLRIDPGAAGAIYINGAKQTDDKYVWADDEAESLCLVADGNGDWVSLRTQGTWTME